jgi:hypothetical protein
MRTFGRMLAAGVLVLAVTALVPAPSADAVSPVPITCTVGGMLEITSGPELTHWKLAGGGSCQGDLDGTYFLPNLVVQGTSDTIGLCGDQGVVTNLSMSATGTLVNFANPMASKTVAGQTWGAAVTTFPFTTPFVITGPNGNQIGGGTMNTRIFGKCPLVGGSPAMTAQFTFLT